MTLFRLQVELVPNQNMRLYQVNFPLCEYEQSFIQWNGDELEQKSYGELPEHCRTIVDGVRRIAGVVKCDLLPNTVRVEKARTSEWADIEPHIVSLVRTVSASILNEEIEYIRVPIRKLHRPRTESF